MNGFLNLNKPSGVTSRDVVNQIQRLVKPAKVGHAGTLDPLATGVLVVAIGQATRLIEYVQDAMKEYRAEFLLGRTSDTEDITGNVIELDHPPIPRRQEIDDLFARFRGKILQRPPAYSALKVQGKRAYALARKGEQVELAPREIEVFGLIIAEYEYPRLVLQIHCSSGTYVRSLGRDIAEAAGTGAVMSSLVRTAIGKHHVRDALDPATLKTQTDVGARLLALASAVSHLPSVNLATPECAKLMLGQEIILPNKKPEISELAVYSSFDYELVALIERRGPEQWGPSRVFRRVE